MPCSIASVPRPACRLADTALSVGLSAPAWNPMNSTSHGSHGEMPTLHICGKPNAPTKNISLPAMPRTPYVSHIPTFFLDRTSIIPCTLFSSHSPMQNTSFCLSSCLPASPDPCSTEYRSRGEYPMQTASVHPLRPLGSSHRWKGSGSTPIWLLDPGTACPLLSPALRGPLDPPQPLNRPPRVLPLVLGDRSEAAAAAAAWEQCCSVASRSAHEILAMESGKATVTSS